MKRERFTEQQIIGVLKEIEAREDERYLSASRHRFRDFL